MMNILNMMFTTLIVLISIAFFTLMERKIISYSQNRKGPNKTNMMGIIQPISDALKLMNKEINLNYKSNFLMFFISPMFNILCSLAMWFSFPSVYTFKFMKMSILFIMTTMSVNIIIIMTMSWSSNSNYSMLGMMRSIAQMISYEINFMFIILTCMNMSEQTNLEMTQKMMKWSPLSLFMPTLMIMWMIIILAETNRTPFDFSEGESEIISGFNIEFSGKSFMFLFLAEYSSILLMSLLTSSLFSTIMMKTTWFIMFYMTICFVFIWTRTTLPRFRYDKLMKMNWHKILPMTMYLLMISFLTKVFYTKN
uniref:NADH-ubiquinone oxidoreductase chain 1 n=1 Tax=Dialeurodes sp. PB-2004 TaxID=267825 RepID=Q6JCR2_9HEMI|nr:NADH dehydrogenase subunit 1 [Dialeurodes sp. PB-2004]